MFEHVHFVQSQAQSIVLETQTQAEQVVHETRSNAQQLAHEVQSHAAQVVHNTQTDAELAVHHGQSQAAFTEDRAKRLMQDHQAELSRVQDIASQAQFRAQTQLHESDARIQQLMALVESQQVALENQRVEHQGMSAQIAALQGIVTMLKHSSTPTTPVQDLKWRAESKRTDECDNVTPTRNQLRSTE